jgi:hypothetical protein
VLGHARIAHQPLKQRQVAAAPGLEGHRCAHTGQPSCIPTGSPATPLGWV